jgi:hypothetical protein
MTAVTESIPFLMEAVSDSVKHQMGHQKADIIPVCLYRQKACSKRFVLDYSNSEK